MFLKAQLAGKTIVEEHRARRRLLYLQQADMQAVMPLVHPTQCGLDEPAAPGCEAGGYRLPAQWHHARRVPWLDLHQLGNERQGRLIDAKLLRQITFESMKMPGQFEPGRLSTLSMFML
jgi:hypothetical protein